MSEMTLITKRYNDMADFTAKVNRSVIVFKKKSILNDEVKKAKYPGLKVSDDELKNAQENLLKSLSDLEALVRDPDYNSKLSGVSESSELRKRNETERREIENIVKTLREGRPLSNADFLMLDKIIAILDNERNKLFRKLKVHG